MYSVFDNNQNIFLKLQKKYFRNSLSHLKKYNLIIIKNGHGLIEHQKNAVFSKFRISDIYRL